MQTVRLSLFGVPVHTAVNDFPAALLPATTLCDVIASATGKESWSIAAFRTLQMGNATALLAGAFGLMDYLRAPKEGEAGSLAKTHAMMNGLLLPMFILGMLLRSARPSRPSVLSMALVMLANMGLFVSGWKGRQLVHVYGVRAGEQGTDGPVHAQIEPATVA